MSESNALERIDKAMYELGLILGDDEVDDLNEQFTEQAVDELSAEGDTTEEALYEKLAVLFEDELEKYKQD
ncbi:hypothetical protein KKH15_01765 [Patescibacteria group bacterium]|nr:hypothetical protein [Patescibacteria group bacterium]MBU1754775.1 hypothetical protein [Patescibacteria group bacterium]